MSRKGIEVVVVICTALLLGPATGCLTLPKQQADVQQLTGTPPAETVSGDADSAQEASDQMPLDAIEEFLRLTEQYALDEPVNPGPLPGTEPLAEPPVGVAVLPQPTSTPPPTQISSPAPPAQAFANERVDLATPAAPAPVTPPAIPVVRSVSVRAPAHTASAAASEPVNATVNTPLQAHGEVKRELFERVLTQLADETDNDDFAGQWRLRLAQLALGRQDAARTLPHELTGTERHLLQGLMDVGLAVSRAARDPVHAAEDALARLDELRTTLVELADPVITTVAFCRRVVTFGVYEKMETTEFAAGQTIHTIVYCEISNFTSELTEDERYRTLLGTRLEALTADGQSVWEHEEPEIEDLCRRRRTDFFLAQRIALPPTLPPGDYILKVLVEDHLGGRVHEASHPFSITTATSIARGGG